MKLSVITVTYNDLPGLARTFRSLESLKIPWEHVVVDSSPEKSGEFFSKLSKDWPLVYCTMPPSGIYAAMNEGIINSSGEAIWFLNSGDTLYRYETLLQTLDTLKNSDLVIASTRLIKNGEFLYNQIPRKNFVNNILGVNRLCHQGLVYRRSIFEKTGYFSTQYKLASDYLHTFECYFTKARVERVNGILAEYEMSGASSNYKNVLLEFKQIHEELAPRLNKKTRLLNSLLYNVNHIWIHFLKYLARSSVHSTLKPVWLWWHR